MRQVSVWVARRARILWSRQRTLRAKSKARRDSHSLFRVRRTRNSNRRETLWNQRSRSKKCLKSKECHQLVIWLIGRYSTVLSAWIGRWLFSRKLKVLGRNLRWTMRHQDRKRILRSQQRIRFSHQFKKPSQTSLKKLERALKIWTVIQVAVWVKAMSRSFRCELRISRKIYSIKYFRISRTIKMSGWKSKTTLKKSSLRTSGHSRKPRSCSSNRKRSSSPRVRLRHLSKIWMLMPRSLKRNRRRVRLRSSMMRQWRSSTKSRLPWMLTIRRRWSTLISWFK